MFNQFLRADCPSLVQKQIFEDGKFLWCEADLFVLFGKNKTCLRIHAEAAERDNRIVLCEIPAQKGTDAGFKLSEIKRLNKIVICPQIKSLNPLFIGASCR